MIVFGKVNPQQATASQIAGVNSCSLHFVNHLPSLTAQTGRWQDPSESVGSSCVSSCLPSFVVW